MFLDSFQILTHFTVALPRSNKTEEKEISEIKNTFVYEEIDGIQHVFCLHVEMSTH